VPFAKAPHVKGQVHYAVCSGGGRRELLAALRTELQALAAADPNERETTLLIVPDQLADFLDFNDVLDDAEALLDELGLAGVLQIAPFTRAFSLPAPRRRHHQRHQPLAVPHAAPAARGQRGPRGGGLSRGRGDLRGQHGHAGKAGARGLGRAGRGASET
jgi:hypothetical protein